MTTPQPGTWDVKFLPPGNVITDATEFAFINGIPFVIASKHGQVVQLHCDEKDRLREALRIIALNPNADADAIHRIAREALDA